MSNLGLRMASSSVAGRTSTFLRFNPRPRLSRNVHRRLNLPYPLEGGLGKFLPPEALKTVAVDYQEGLLNRLDDEVRGSPEARENIAQTVLNTASREEYTLAFNYASLALNNSFFLDHLKPPPPAGSEWQNHQHEISSHLAIQLGGDYGTLRQLKSTFSAAAMGMFTNGFLWFVCDINGNFAIVPTFGPGTLLIRSRSYMVLTPTELGRGFKQYDPDAFQWTDEAEGEALEGDDVQRLRAPTGSMNIPPPSSSPVSGTSGGKQPPSIHDFRHPKFFSSSTPRSLDMTAKSNVYKPAEDQPRTGKTDALHNLGAELYPLFCLPIYEHMWMSAGFGVWGKEEWLKEFWSCRDDISKSWVTVYSSRSITGRLQRVKVWMKSAAVICNQCTGQVILFGTRSISFQEESAVGVVMRLLTKTLALLCAATALAKTRRGLQSSQLLPRLDNGFQDIVTWDEYSLLINGKRVMIFSGEVHPYRALGFNAVSFYTFWGLHEYKRGEISFDGFRDLQPFFDAAKEAGIYLIARPGPYINAETTGGGFPGWGTHTAGLWRTENSTFVDAMSGYVKAVGSIIAANQITKGGPVILVQAENEYSGFQAPYTEDFDYEKILLDQFVGSLNLAWPYSEFNDIVDRERLVSRSLLRRMTLGQEHILQALISMVRDLPWLSHDSDIRTGYDSYPNGFDCSNPYDWASDAVPEYFWDSHLSINPQAPNAVYEFQGGAFDGWGGAGYEGCAVRLGPEFERAQGILNYNGQNTLAVSLWAADAEGGKLGSLDLEITAKVETSRSPVVNQPLTAWSTRPGAY
ncbi:hypothetical protein H0H93_006756 [Arthromyces matolae]|nr:hypothetical protein H0H93_006756 [Arthromyces matolae]